MVLAPHPGVKSAQRCRLPVRVSWYDAAFAESLFALGAAEGGHRVLLRAIRGADLPNDRAFLAWRFADPRDALSALAETGLLDDADRAVRFPGPLPVSCRGVSGLVPETTEDAELWS